MRIPGFLGPANVSRSINVDDEDTINFYPELRDAGTPKAQVALYGTPGLRVFAAPLGPATRGSFYQDRRAFLVIGPTFYEVFATHTVLSRGTVADDGSPVSICSNGTGGDQLFVVSAGLGYIYDLTANTLTQIADPDFPANAGIGGFIDGYFVVTQLNTAKFYISQLEDGTSWDGLDVAQLSEGSDNLVSMLINHREVWLFGSKTTEVWYDAGTADFPFAPIQGVFIEYGCLAPWSPQRLDQSILWVGLDERGSGVVVRADGYTPKPISTHAIDLKLQGFANLPSAEGWTYQDQGHTYYLLYVPGSDRTACYDVVTNMWHWRATWDPLRERWLPHVGRSHMFAFNRHLVGDRERGVLYDMRLEYYDEETV